MELYDVIERRRDVCAEFTASVPQPFLQDLLAIPAHVRPVAWLCVGPVSGLPDVPDLERHGRRARRPLSDAVHHETYGG